MDLLTFRARFPEFVGVEDLTVEATLAEALLSTIYGKRIDEAQGYLTAHKLALSPYGQAARLADGNTTTYAIHFKEIQRELSYGYRVTGQQPSLGLNFTNLDWPFLS